MSTVHKAICAALLFMLWGFFVWLGKAPVDPFITTIRDALIALGVFQAVLTNPKG